MLPPKKKKTKIDAAGRVIVPKAMRDELGLAPGSDLLISVQNGEIVVEPAPMKVKLVRRGTTLVAVPLKPVPTLKASVVRKTLERIREGR